MSFPDSWASFSLSRTMIVLVIVLLLATFDLFQRSRGRSFHLLAGCVLGSALSLGILEIGHIFNGPSVGQNPYGMALAILVMYFSWKALFGPWQPITKVTVLGTFIFWVGFHMLSQQPADTRNLQLISAAIALVPAGIWCALFLKYHKERISVVLLMFFSGMLSTLPILFYDMLVRRGAEFQFFLFRITPESFSQTSQGFVSGQLAGGNGTQSLLMTTLVSFLIVGVIEEMSKYWVLYHSGRSLLRSIDDGLELAIIVAIGFAFAENVVNPVYFGGFVREYLLTAHPDILGFISNVLGRSVLTSMVHILSTGVMGYCMALSVFAGSFLSEREAQGKGFALLVRLQSWTQLREITIFRVLVLTLGIILAVGLHALFNFMVTLPDMLPNHPHALGDLLGISIPIISDIPLLLLPSMLYVVGGFWFLTSLFLRRENMEERGRAVSTETFVRD